MSSESAPDRGLGRALFGGEGWPYLLVPFIPLAIALDLIGFPRMST